MNWYEKKRLSEQLSFFNSKKKGFISCYAKKPRIRISTVKSNVPLNNNNTLIALRQQQLQLDSIRNFEYQLAVNQQSQLANTGMLRGAQGLSTGYLFNSIGLGGIL